ncbi:hypothetical protein [Methylobacterium durans]|uniref:hypothetical protein n=1 Tax=Methylobacterium durans TaxID=2202825 RepID=UPI0013A55B27|nr:hypothetical protein [Methylobacterium durans]
MEKLVDRSNTTRQTERKNAESLHEILPALPENLWFLFDDKPLLPDEDVGQYDAILNCIVQQVKPSDVVETLWVKNIIDLIWESKRLQLWRSRILAQARLEAAEELMRPVLDANALSTDNPQVSMPYAGLPLAVGWVAGIPGALNKFEEYMCQRGLTSADVSARAFQIKLADIERIDRLIANADHRRDTLLREIERKRANLGQKLRLASTDAVDAEIAPQVNP